MNSVTISRTTHYKYTAWHTLRDLQPLNLKTRVEEMVIYMYQQDLVFFFIVAKIKDEELA
jgi:hypothetical protein